MVSKTMIKFGKKKKAAKPKTKKQGQKQRTKKAQRPGFFDRLALHGITPKRITGTIMVLVLISLASFKLALLATGFAVTCAFVSYDAQRRKSWESRTQKQLERLAENHNTLVHEVTRNTKDISALRKNIRGIANNLDVAIPAKSLAPENMQQQKRQEYAEKLKAIALRPRSSAMSKKSSNKKNSNVLNLEVMPKFLKPEHDISPGLQKQKMSFRTPPGAESLAANDPYGDDVPVFSDSVVSDLVRQTIDKQKPEIFLQPVMALPQRKAHGYEVFTRVRAKPGLYLTATRYLPLIEKKPLIGELDVMTLIGCLKVLGRDKKETPGFRYFLNVTGKTLKNPLFMKEFVAFLAVSRKLASRVVFELSQNEYNALDAKAIKVMETLKTVGCCFSMDHIYDANLNILKLKECGFEYIKLDTGWLREQAEIAETFQKLADRKRLCDAKGIKIIAEKIETEDDLRALMDLNFSFGQGFLLGKPDLQGVYTPDAIEKRAS